MPVFPSSCPVVPLGLPFVLLYFRLSLSLPPFCLLSIYLSIYLSRTRSCRSLSLRACSCLTVPSFFLPFTFSSRFLELSSFTVHLCARRVHGERPVMSSRTHTVSLSSVTPRSLDNAIASSLFHLCVSRETTKQAGQCRRRCRRRCDLPRAPLCTGAHDNTLESLDEQRLLRRLPRYRAPGEIDSFC